MEKSLAFYFYFWTFPTKLMWKCKTYAEFYFLVHPVVYVTSIGGNENSVCFTVFYMLHFFSKKTFDLLHKMLLNTTHPVYQKKFVKLMSYIYNILASLATVLHCLVIATHKMSTSENGWAFVQISKVYLSNQQSTLWQKKSWKMDLKINT